MQGRGGGARLSRHRLPAGNKGGAAREEEDDGRIGILPVCHVLGSWCVPRGLRALLVFRT